MKLNGDVSSIFCNGHKDPYIFCNGVQVWPAKYIIGYRVYLEFDPDETVQMSFKDFYWNGTRIGAYDVRDVSKKNGSTWSSLSFSEYVNIFDSGTSIYCNAFSFIVDRYSFSTFRWNIPMSTLRPTHDIKITVQENSTTGIKVVAQKMVTQTDAAQTFIVNAGDTIS